MGVLHVQRKQPNAHAGMDRNQPLPVDTERFKINRPEHGVAHFIPELAGHIHIILPRFICSLQNDAGHIFRDIHFHDAPTHQRQCPFVEGKLFVQRNLALRIDKIPAQCEPVIPSWEKIGGRRRLGSGRRCGPRLVPHDAPGGVQKASQVLCPLFGGLGGAGRLQRGSDGFFSPFGGLDGVEQEMFEQVGGRVVGHRVDRLCVATVALEQSRADDPVEPDQLFQDRAGRQQFVKQTVQCRVGADIHPRGRAAHLADSGAQGIDMAGVQKNVETERLFEFPLRGGCKPVQRSFHCAPGDPGVAQQPCDIGLDVVADVGSPTVGRQPGQRGQSGDSGLCSGLCSRLYGRLYGGLGSGLCCQGQGGHGKLLTLEQFQKPLLVFIHSITAANGCQVFGKKGFLGDLRCRGGFF